MASLIRQKITRYVGPDGKRCKPTDPGARKVEDLSRKWYAVGIPGLGTKRVPLSTDKRVSLKQLNDLIDRAERGEAGLPAKGEGQQPLEALVTEFGAALGRKAGPKHTRFVLLNVRRVLTGCRLSTLADLRAAGTTAKVEAFVWSLAEGEGAMSPVNAANVGKHAKQFARWLHRKRKVLQHDPLAGVDLPSQATVNRRRPLTPAELATLFETTAASAWEFRGLSGPDRAMVYYVGAASGYRAGELAALTPAHFDLDADAPVIRLEAARTKNGEAAVQDISRAAAERVRPYLTGRLADAPVWPGTWWERAADMIRADMTAAGIPIEVNGEAAVFHSLRHFFGTEVGKRAPVRVAQDLVRHSTPVLTIGRYGHADRSEREAVVEQLPLPGAGQGGPFASLARPQLEQYAEAVTAVLAGLWGVLVTPMVTPDRDSTGDGLIRAGTSRAGKSHRTMRVKG